MYESNKRSVSPFSRNKYKLSELDQSDLNVNSLEKEDETHEVASQLSLIRKRHDKTKESNQKKRLYCEKLKLELEKANVSSNLSELDAKTLEQKISHLQTTLENNRHRHEEENLCKKSYLYMLDRMKKEKISMELKAHSLQVSLKSSKHVLDAETDKFRKVRESQYQSKITLQEIKQTLAYDQRKQNEKLQQLERNVKKREELAYRREERQKRQADLSEAAANDDKDSEELQLKEALLVNRMWFAFLVKKFQMEREKSADVEEAYQMIRGATGISDINEVVEKFLTKEQNYEMLLKAVYDAEMKLEGLKKRNSTAREALKENQFEEGTSARKVYSEIDEIEKKLCEGYNDYAVAKEKMQKNISLYDTVLNWGEKLFHNLEITEKLEVCPGLHAGEAGNTLEEMFEIIDKRLNEVMMPLESSKEDTRIAVDLLAKKNIKNVVEDISFLGNLNDPKKKVSESETENLNNLDF